MFVDIQYNMDVVEDTQFNNIANWALNSEISHKESNINECFLFMCNMI